MHFQCDFFFLRTVMNKFPHYHNWWEALTYQIIHQCTQMWHVYEKLMGLGIVGCWLRLLTVAPKTQARLGVCLCWCWMLPPSVGGSHSLGVDKPKWVTQWCALIGAACCSPCAERCSFVTERKKPTSEILREDSVVNLRCRVSEPMKPNALLQVLINSLFIQKEAKIQCP